MAEYIAKRNPNRCPSHPGALLRDVIPATGKTKVEIARLLGISRQHLHDIMEEKNHCRRRLPCVWANFSGEVLAPGFGCRVHTIHGMLNGMSTSARSQR